MLVTMMIDYKAQGRDTHLINGIVLDAHTTIVFMLAPLLWLCLSCVFNMWLLRFLLKGWL